MLQIWENNPILRQKSQKIQKITPEIKNIIKEMFQEMELHEWVWISACQIWYNLQISIITLRDSKKSKEVYLWDEVLINPQVLHVSKETYIEEEWCLSLPDVYWKVRRPKRAVIKYQDLNMKKITKKFFWLTARIALHEIDHLNWILFIDKLVS